MDGLQLEGQNPFSLRARDIVSTRELGCWLASHLRGKQAMGRERDILTKFIF